MNIKRMRKPVRGRSALAVAGRMLLAASLLSLSVKPSWCAPKDDVWNFTTPAQMEKAIPKYLDNPRATYYVIMRARHHNLVDRAALLYGSLLKTRHGGNEFYVMSAYAFSHFMAVGPLAREHFVQHGSPTVEKLRRQALEADFYRKEAMEGKPNSPEVLLMSALPAFYMATNRSAKMKALNQVRRAVKLASSWADAHFWLGQVLLLSSGFERNRTPMAREALAAYQKAEQLQPALHGDCLYGYMSAHSQMKQPREALKYMDAYIKLRPAFGKSAVGIRWRQSLTKQLQAKSS